MNNDSEEKIVHAAPVPPFVTFVTSAVPMVFDNSMSYYEALCALWKWLQDDVIDVINNNASVTELWRAELTEFEEDLTDKFDDLSDEFDQLEEFVNTYFDNLDVQEEINNKLDAMVEDGTLQTLINNFLQPNVTWTFDTVADMQASDNLVNGGYARTLGYHTINDEGGALYFITNSGTADGATVISVGSLYAHLVTPTVITPEIFGAYGDGTTDDTNAVRAALKYSIDNGKQLLINKKYYVKQSLLTSTDYNTQVNLNIEGKSSQGESYAVDNSGIIFDNGLDLFDGLTITGRISKVCFAPVSRTQTGSIFNECTLSKFNFSDNYVCNILAFLHNTGTRFTTKIMDNKFFTVYFFAKCDDSTKHECTDTEIGGNYINGGEEMNDNTCFEFVSFNGTTVHDNFIDYYRSIYEPNSPSAAQSTLPSSLGNQYQVFRYLYWKRDNISSLTFSSVGDCFNWTKTTSLPKLGNYTTYTYTGHDTNTHDVPPYIMYVDPTCLVTIVNAYLQANLDNVIFIKRSLSEYKYGAAKFTYVATASMTKYDYLVSEADSFYNAGSYRNNLVDIPFIKTLESLPASIPNWSNYYLGERVIVSNVIYRLTYDYANSQFEWIEDHSI